MRSFNRLLAISTVTLVALGGAAPALAVIQANPGCVDDVSGRSNNCTANDVTFVLVGLGVQDDGCVSDTDTVSIFLRADVRNTTATTRYDIGLYMATDGDPNGDGARTGGCARQHLTPVGAANMNTCPPLNLLGGSGPYLNAETGSSNSTPDSCGDLNSGGNTGCDSNSDGVWDDSVFTFPTAITFPCRDLPPPNGDGFVNIPTCATWGQQANEISTDANSTCDSELELVPGTPSKCRCEDKNTTIPAPNLSLSCSCTPSSVQPGQTATCTVTYTNNRTCTPNLADPERFRCGAASFVRFKADYDESAGSVSMISPTTGSAVDDTTQIVWTPASGLGTSGIIGQGDTGTLTYEYTVDAGTSTGLTLSFQTSSWWSDVNTFSPEVQQAALTCGATVATPVTLASVHARRDGVIEWSTATEAGTVGFNVYAETADGWHRINDQPISATGVDSTTPQRYRLEVEGLAARRIAIEDLDFDGKTRFHGPFEVGQRHGSKTPEQPVDWAAVRAAARRPAGPAAQTAGVRAGRQALELAVTRDGVHRLTYEQLRAAGFDLRGAADRLALTRRGEAVPVRIEGARNFGPGSFLEFYGEGLDTLYTDTGVYLLEADPRAGRRIATDARKPSGPAAPSYLETVELRRNRAYSFGSPTDDPWFDTRMLAYTAPVAFDFALEVDELAAGPASLQLSLWGSTSWPESPDHHVRVSLNGVELADERFDGRADHPIVAAIPAGVLHQGTNVVTVELPGDLGVDFDLINLESVAITYPRALVARDGGLRFAGAGGRFEVAGLPGPDVVAYRLDAGGPVRLTGVTATPAGGGWTAVVPGAGGQAEYLVADAGSLPVPGLARAREIADITGRSAEYLVITHPAFRDALDRLVGMRRAEGWTVEVVDVEDVYDQFGGGVVDPHAIRAYIAHAVERMGTEMVLLVGGDTYDYRGYLGGGSVSFIPTLYTATGPIIRHAPADSMYADLDGDLIPEVAIGRFPVRSVAELESLIDKTLDYAGKDYRRTAVFAADLVEAAASFSQESEDFALTLGDGWEVARAYMDWSSLVGARTQLLGSIDDGVALTSFIGHSGPSAWTFSGLFNSADAAALTNTGRPTVVVQWGCWNTYHVEPHYNTLGHALLLSGDRGAAAVLGSATLLETSSAAALSERLAPKIARPGVTIGQAVRGAKKELATARPELLDVLLGWTLLGDPALVVEP